MENKKEVEYWKKQAEYYLDMATNLLCKMAKGTKVTSMKLTGEGVVFVTKDLESAYTEGYTVAESKYRKIFDEFLGIVFCKDCKHWRNDDHICQYYGGASPRLANDFCSKGERREK